ncbi:protein-L-isoaspartate(D-aspartate) O-methyltransferase [Thiohalophilus thiocyanatoxydans]|uniref:Protein-L-isoaspartate O-methyltransferase n=1 Tax=Thiohalophilus thiocyanatoxydans TaxID=381308 RepID=A0A4R8IHS7_9GAMM|nr:protein-L-isoaspartate(D-aspartate) O-methyltransferase [Thiohalophilus thiocyanatoxydans]TDY00142.1 protein-L-isoaspartate(D-aspartate) O-methyltransferase [Thiohalophilus thiocyanatoxydans]
MNSHLGIGMTSQRTRDRLIERLREKGITNEAVLEVMRRTPRHIFVDEALATRAYEDTALPIGSGQTISQPYIVARMTEVLLGAGSPQRVLEVGTGCGYQTAILAQLVEKVFTVERIAPLLQRARNLLYELRLSNVRYQHSDGNWGWQAHAPYDGIIVTAAPQNVPPELLGQLGDGGRLVIPTGGQGQIQRLRLITRQGDEFNETLLESVSFVPLVQGDIS